jgi:arylsulfatase A-like enzyme
MPERTPEYKYIAYRDDPVTQLFDMRADPGELNNLATASAKADVVRDLAGRLVAWEKSLDILPLKEPQPSARKNRKRKQT